MMVSVMKLRRWFMGNQKVSVAESETVGDEHTGPEGERLTPEEEEADLVTRPIEAEENRADAKALLEAERLEIREEERAKARAELSAPGVGRDTGLLHHLPESGEVEVAEPEARWPVSDAAKNWPR